MTWTKERHEAAKDIDALTGNAKRDALAEIERGWAEIERYEESEGAWHEATGANGAEDALGIMRTLRARLSHAHDAANKLYQAASEACAHGHPRTTDIDALARALDPAEAEAAAREATRRDGLEKEINDLRSLLSEARHRLRPLPRALTPEDHEPDTLPARIAAALGGKDH